VCAGNDGVGWGSPKKKPRAKGPGNSLSALHITHIVARYPARRGVTTRTQSAKIELLEAMLSDIRARRRELGEQGELEISPRDDGGTPATPSMRREDRSAA
jgi:hypothetical protein